MTHATSTLTSRRPRPHAGTVFSWVALTLLLLVTLFPFIWMLRTAFTSNADIFSGSMSVIPENPTAINFTRVLGLATVEEDLAAGGTGAGVDFFLYLRNSILFTGALVIGQVGFSALAAYAFARLRFKGRDVLFAIFLSALMVPPIFTVLPNFVLMRNLGWIDTFAGLVAPYLLMTPFAIFFLRQFFLAIPREIEEAALLDGAGRFRIFSRVIAPMAAAPIATLAIITAVTAWNEYMWPQLIGRSPDVRLLNVAVAAFAQSSPSTSPDWAGLMAAASLQVIPMVVLLLIFGRKIINSIGFTGVK
ncbi:carbohydrate ABC transporter permease [Glaciibacter psychrotolerans]|uniref:Multiple sugar transport system permease protein n=1 Tax=Glaciibacter psychrotolerans TaxID=670054 RepID=A0A7Z0EG84_9MICO|nr:carbohydrate ABC transporter permease [Leifsonia psychrotolerans]NYJ21101.1 multiple sugar transport system permease protein [Leifsonia psychrotolerans]